MRTQTVLLALAVQHGAALNMRGPGSRAQAAKAARSVKQVHHPLARLYSTAESGEKETTWECTPPAAPVDCVQVEQPRKKERLVVRMDDRWVDLTGWRKAHPAGSHWIDVFDKNDATEVMHAFHSDTAMQMLARLPNAKDADVPLGAPDVTPHTRNFRTLRAQLLQDGWFKRDAFKEAKTLTPWVVTMALAWKASASAHPWLAALLLGVANTSAGWIAHDYIHGRGRWPSLMRGFGELGGGMSATWWSDKHNMHHALTNVVGVDEDLMVDPALFLWAPAKENDNPMIRKVQHLYWALPYSFLFAIWRIDSLKVAFQRKLWGECARLGAHYALLFALFPARVLLPAVFLSGLLTATIVTVSHVTEDIFFDGPHKVDYVESQFRSTRDFVCSNPGLEYLAGGMNYQLEHHLSPTMPRYMYPKLVPVIKKFAAENNLPYKVDGDWAILKRTVAKLRDVAKLPQDPTGPSTRSDEWVLPAAQR